MEHERSGNDVIRAARRMDYAPAIAILTAYPSLGGDWQAEGAQSMLVKPMNTEDLLRQIETLLIQHENKREIPKKPEPKAQQSVQRSGAARPATKPA